VAQVESNAREPDHSICMVKKVKRGVGIGLTFLRFRVYVYAFPGDTRRYRCFDSLTVAHQSRFSSEAIYTGESPFLMTSRPPSLRKRNSVSGRPCIVLPSLVGIGTNGTHSLASLIGVKANCELFEDMVFGRCQSCLLRPRPLPPLHYPSFCHLFVVSISPSFHSLLRDLC